jgi:septal ring factor EnvC (AmiA/AmiB activator)
MQTRHKIYIHLAFCFVFFHFASTGTPSRLETKKHETIKHELDDMKQKLSAMSADNNRLKSNLSQFDGRDKQQRMKIDEQSQQMAETLEKLRSASKEKVMNKKIQRIGFNWIIKSKMRIAGSLIAAKLLRISFFCSFTGEPSGRVGSREAVAPDKEARS